MAESTLFPSAFNDKNFLLKTTIVSTTKCLYSAVLSCHLMSYWKTLCEEQMMCHSVLSAFPKSFFSFEEAGWLSEAVFALTFDFPINEE